MLAATGCWSSRRPGARRAKSVRRGRTASTIACSRLTTRAATQSPTTGMAARVSVLYQRAPLGSASRSPESAIRRYRSRCEKVTRARVRSAAPELTRAARSSGVAPRRSRFMTVTPGVAVDWVAWTAPRRFGERTTPANRAQARRRAKPRTGLSDSPRLWTQDSIELMRTNTARERLAKGEVVYGCGLQVYRAPEIPRAFAAAGFDYVFIDMEHGSFNLETAHDMIIACKLAGITPIVRVGEVQYTLCARLLDQGAQGIILPRVEDPKVLEEALSWLRFPPLGIRGFGINPTMVD